MVNLANHAMRVLLLLALLGQAAVAQCVACGCCGAGGSHAADPVAESCCGKSGDAPDSAKGGVLRAETTLRCCNCVQPPREPAVSAGTQTPRAPEAPLCAGGLAVVLVGPPSDAEAPAAADNLPPGPTAQRMLCVYRC